MKPQPACVIAPPRPNRNTERYLVLVHGGGRHLASSATTRIASQRPMVVGSAENACSEHQTLRHLPLTTKLSTIEWTDVTWNPTTGCSRVSPGCEHCYAERLSLRFGWSGKPWTAPNAPDNVRLHFERLASPVRWKQPARVFVNSMSDLFHELVPFDFVSLVFDAMEATQQHTYQILTKRPRRMRAFITERIDSDRGRNSEPLANVWLGTSAEDQRRADERLPILLDTPASIHFVSCEPLLGPVDLTAYLVGLRWVIDGGESGPGRRLAQPDWFRSIRDQCRSADIAYFHKQGNSVRPGEDRLLDDELWEQFPTVGRRSGEADHGAGRVREASFSGR
jgi:protein gp37